MSTNDKSKPVPNGILIEAEDFDNHGGWVLDSQFETQMGSPYLLAHGLDRPVGDATTTVSIPEAGDYEVWVRAKDWGPEHHPGRFTLSINDILVETEFGANDKDWSWQSAGKVFIPKGDIPFRLHDLTGFDGRCDAIYLSSDDSVPPNAVDTVSRSWRRALRGLTDEPADSRDYDVVVAPDRYEPEGVFCHQLMAINFDESSLNL